MTITKQWNAWLSDRKGKVIRAEQFHQFYIESNEDNGDWRFIMSDLVTKARKEGQLKPAGLTRDKFGSWKAKWRVA